MIYTYTSTDGGVIHSFEITQAERDSLPLTVMELADLNECARSRLMSDRLESLKILAAAIERQQFEEAVTKR